MAFDQPNQPPHRQQAQAEQANSAEMSLPRITSEEWEYNRYNSGSMNNRNYYANSYPPQQPYPPQAPPPQEQQQQVDYASRPSYPTSSWEQVY
jgi:hypothetical protein